MKKINNPIERVVYEIEISFPENYLDSIGRKQLLDYVSDQIFDLVHNIGTADGADTFISVQASRKTTMI